MLIIVMVKWYTAVGDVASFQSDHSEFVLSDTRRSIPAGKRNTTAEVLGNADVIDSQRCRYRVVVHVDPFHTSASAGSRRHCSVIAVSRRVRHALRLRI